MLPAPAVTGIYFLAAFLVCVVAFVVMLNFKFNTTRSSFFNPPPIGNAKNVTSQPVDETTNPISEHGSKTDDVNIPSDPNAPSVLSTNISLDPDDSDDFANGHRLTALDTVELKESLPFRESTAEEITERLTMEGHIVFVNHLQFPTGTFSCNPGKRADRMFRESMRMNNSTVFELALKEGADMSLRSTLAYSVLHECVALDAYAEFLSRILANNGTELVNCRTSHGTTPLMKAVEFKQLGVVQLLLQQGAEVNAQDGLGHTALMIGAMSNTAWAARVLIPWNADPDLVDIDGRRAVDLALLHGNARVASDLNGSAMAVVPGYIAPRVQNNYDGLNLIYIIAWHSVDVITDVLLAISLAHTGHPVLCFFTVFFLLMPSMFIFCIPYQSTAERVITLCQMRIVYEGLISMGQERLTVRFGATQMYHTVLQNVPQAMMQTYMLASLSEGHFHADATSLILAIISTIYQSTTTFHNMYLMRFFVKNNDSGTQALYIKVGLTIGLMMGVIVRVTMWASTLLLYPQCTVILFVWTFLTRFRLMGLGKDRGNKEDRSQLEATIVDLFAAFLSDMPFITNSQLFLTSLLLSSFEMIVFLGPCIPSWHDYVAANTLTSFFWLWFLFCLGLAVYVHGDSCIPPDRAFFVELLSARKLWHQLKYLLIDAVLNTRVAYTVLAKEFASFRAKMEKARTVPVPTAQASVSDSDSATVTADNDESATKAGKVGSNNSSATENVSTAAESADLEAGTSSSKSRTNTPPSATPTSTPSATAERQRQQMSSPVGERKKSPAPPPILSENLLTFKLPELRWETLERRECISMCLVLLVVMFGCFALVSAMAQCHRNPSDDDVDDSIVCAGGFDEQFGTFGITVSPYLMIVFFVGYFVEAVTCKVALALRNLWQEERGYDAYLTARGLWPSFYWYSEAYHMETRTVTTTVSDGRGGTTTTTRTEQVKVVTHTASMYYEFDYWTDDSDPYPSNIDLCRVDSANDFNFDSYTRSDFDTRYAKFKRDNDTDVCQNCSSTYRIGGKTENALPHMLIYSLSVPYFLRYTYFLCAVLLLLAPWYRWYVTNMSNTCKVRIIKKVRKYEPGADKSLVLRWGDSTELM